MFQAISNQRFSALIDLSHGANCVQLRDMERGITVLREPADMLFPDSPYLYGMPILFPVNRIADGRFDFDGRLYQYPINEKDTNCHCHGGLCGVTFQVVRQKSDEILCSYHAEAGELYPGFPHAFEVTICYRLTEFGMELTVRLTNHSEMKMPVMLGFHTTFPLPFTEGQQMKDICVQADVGTEIARDSRRHLPTGELLPPDKITTQLKEGLFSPATQDISRHYIANTPGLMRLIDRRQGVEIRYENSAEMPYRLLLSNARQGYICLEPQTCMVDCANAPFDRETTGLTFIEPHGFRVYSSRISVMDCQQRNLS